MDGTAKDGAGSPGWRRWSNLVFAGLFALTLLLFGRIVLPFALPVLLGGFLVVLCAPLHAAVSRWVAHRVLAASVSTAAVFALVLVPLAAIAILLAREGSQALAYAQALLDRVDLRRELVAQVPEAVRRTLHLDPGGKAVQDALLSVVAAGAGLLPGVLGAGTELLVELLVMTMATYYFFLDGPRLLREGLRLVPIDPRYTQQFCLEFRDVSRAMAYGNALTSLGQGACTLVGFWLAGVPHAPLWALAAVVLSLVPVGGTALVWGPVGVGLLLMGKYAEGCFVLAWGALVVVTVMDNVVRPKLCGAKMALHPLLLFLSMFGGIAVFGMMGLLVGPLIGALCMAMVRIYRRDYLGLQPLDAPETAAPTPATALGSALSPEVTPTPTPPPAPVPGHAVAPAAAPVPSPS